MISTKIPPACVNQQCVLGVDEAGRGPVLGPMVYACAFWPLSQVSAMQTEAFDDSKKLKESDREEMFESIKANDMIGYVTCELSADFLSTSMQRHPVSISLNKLATDATIDMIELVLKSGVDVREIYVDALGNCEYYEKLLGSLFPSCQITVKPKADSLFKVVSAASICAKVTRDLKLANWTFDEPGLCPGREWGSGYPGDERTKQWLKDNMDPVFGFPRLVRFSWQTSRTILESDAKRVEFASERPLAASGTRSIASAFEQAKSKRVHYFASRGMSSSVGDDV